MNEQNDSDSELDLMKLINETQKYVIVNKELYSQTAKEVIDGLYRILFNKHLSIIGINHRLKSSESLKEKLIRKKLYKGCAKPEQIIGKMSDIIGIMIECEFVKNEKTIFDCIQENFNITKDNVFYQSGELPNVYINLGVSQPVRQKNGNELYKLDCYYMADNKTKINFELQIKSLVNSFWCEVEHNIVYKNNYYISSDDYVSEMLSAVRINLTGLDKILELINERINALTTYTVVKDLELNEDLAKQLVSDLINAKMIESVGFTVEAKRIRDLLSWYIMHGVSKLPEEDKMSAFYELSNLFRELHKIDFTFDRKINIQGHFHADDLFSQAVGGKLITLMNTDFEWHTFFVMLFHIWGKDGGEECFRVFVGTLKNLFCDSASFDGLFDRLPNEDAQAISDEAQLFIAEALCHIGDLGILRIEDYKKSIADVNGFLQYTLNCLDDMNEWVNKRSAVEAVIVKSLQKTFDI